jgi:hypothetical protein
MYSDRDCPVRFPWLKVLSIDRSLSKGEAPWFSTDIAHPFLCERPFKCRRHLIKDLGDDKPVFQLLYIPMVVAYFLTPY